MPSRPNTRRQVVSVERDCSCTRGDRTPFNCWSCDADRIEPEFPRGELNFVAGPLTSGRTWSTLPENLTDVWLIPERAAVIRAVEDDRPDHVIQAVVRHEMGAKVKVWHDDVRLPPDPSWIWCRTNHAVREIAMEVRIDELSMDHDLGGSDIPESELSSESDFWKLDGDETGVDLADWLGATDNIPERVIIHTMNPDGGRNILAAFLAHNDRINNSPIIGIEPFSR